VLDYDEPARYPRLFVPPGDRVRYESRRLRKPPDEVKKILAARTEPTPADRKVVTDALARTSRLVLHFAQIDKGHMDFGIEEGILADLAEDALASPACTPAQARELRKYLAAIAYFALHPDFVPPRTAGFAWGSANMMAQVRCRACRIAALLPGHPRGKEWREQLAKVVTLYVEDQINPAGATLECPHYGTMAIQMPVMGLAALASCGDVDLSRPARRLRAAAHLRLAALLPPDVRGGYRSQIPEGDGYYAGESVFAPLAGFFQKTDPNLARQLAWGVNESNHDLGGHSDSTFKLFDVGVEPLQPPLRSELFDGYGFVMRNGFPRADEAYLQVYAGGFSWGHGHNDRGTWVLYAKGAPLMVDFAAMYTPSMREQWMHPGGLTFQHDEAPRPPRDDGTDDWWRKSRSADYRALKTAPFTAVEPRPDPQAAGELDTFGKVTAFRSLPAADYAEMQRRLRYLHRVPFGLQPTHGKDLFDDGVSEEVYLKEPFVWTRRFVFVKDADPMGHNYLVIRDLLPGNTELDPYLNLWCLATEVKVAEDQVQLQIPQARRDGGYFVAMVPVKRGEAPPKFETLAGGKALRVSFGDRVDTIVLSPQAGELVIDGRKIVSPAALIVRRGEKTEVNDLAAKAE